MDQPTHRKRGSRSVITEINCPTEVDRFRQRIFDALELYVSLVVDYMPEAKLWVDGGFVTHKPEPPKDVDVVVITPPTPMTFEQALPLLTLQGVTFAEPFPGQTDRLQPMSGLVDGFILDAQNVDALDYFHWEWSRVKDQPDTELKGYVEVRL